MMHIGLHVAKVRREMESITSSMLFIKKKGVPDHRRKKNWHSRPSPPPRNKGFFPLDYKKNACRVSLSPGYVVGKVPIAKITGWYFPVLLRVLLITTSQTSSFSHREIKANPGLQPHQEQVIESHPGPEQFRPQDLQLSWGKKGGHFSGKIFVWKLQLMENCVVWNNFSFLDHYVLQ